MDPTTVATPAATPTPPPVAIPAAPVVADPVAPATPATPTPAPPADVSALTEADVSQPAVLAIPKGFEPQSEALQAAVKDLGLDGEKAQKMLETVASVDAVRQKALDDAFVAQDQKWAAELQADSEIGGAKFKGAMTDVQRALRRFGGADGKPGTPLARLLHSAGLGNHPLVIKAFAAVGRSLADDTVSGTIRPAPPATERLSDAELFYGPTTPSNKEQ